jgi:glyoxylase-like metal-dependent hydrolase (beta-lactamase superfamily II)
MDGQSKKLRGRLACHCLLLEGDGGLILIDTGFGTRDVEQPRKRLSPFFRALVAPELRLEMTALRQIEAMGFDPRDVRHIVLTHLDFDHAGGLDDFPQATVHLLQSERDYAVQQKTWMDRQRFRPQQWSTQAQWRTYLAGEGEPWFGFDCVRHLEGLNDEVLLVPLIGHTFGHCGVAVNTGGRWLLLAGDAYFYHREMDAAPYCTPGLRFYQWMLEKDRHARLWNQERLRQLRAQRSDEVELFSSHDTVEFSRLSGRDLDRPALPVVHPVVEEERPLISIAPGRRSPRHPAIGRHDRFDRSSTVHELAPRARQETRIAAIARGKRRWPRAC